MFSRPLFSIRTTLSTFSRTHRFLFLTFAFVLALGGVAISKSPALREVLRLSAAPKPSVSAQAPLQRTAGKKIDLLRMVGVNRASTQPSSLANPLAPSVSATKSDSLFTDVDGDLQADPGDTLKYTVNISASGDDATGVTFTDTVDPNTAFVGGSLRATPVALDDSYAATGNVRISVAAPGVLGNDFAGVPSATITAPPSMSANGGDVTLNADGSFTYNPPAGFEGTDTFNYTLTNSEGSNSGTVSITVSGMIWFIDNNAAACTTLAAGCGRLTNPFSSLSAFASLNNGAGNNPAANDNIFVYESASDYAGPVTLLNGQRFIGQDATASLSSITGLTPPAGSDPLPTTNSANGTIVNITTGNAITVGSGNTLTGFTGGNSTTDISGTAFGTLTISDVTLNGTGEALNLNTGALNATFGSISSTNSGTTGINLTGVAGNLTSPTTTITNPAGIGISVATSTAILNFGNTTSTLSGGTGVSLLTNTSTITFGSLDISPDANQKGLVATDNSGTITSTSGAISTSSATAVEITRVSGTTPLAISQTGVSSSGGSGNGIILSNTSGSFTVVGTGTAASGGTIANKTGADGSTTQGTGIYLSNATNISLSWMQLNGFQNYGIRGLSVTGFTLANTIINGANGTSSAAATREGAIHFDGLFGSASISDSTIGGTGALDSSFSDNLRVFNTSGSLDRLTITNSSFGKIGATGNDSLVTAASNNGTVMKVTVTGSTFTNAIASLTRFNTSNNSTLDLVFRQNKLSNNNPNQASGGGALSLQTDAVNSPTVTFDISCNRTRDSIGNALLVAMNGGAGTANGSIINNTIGVTGSALSGSSQASGIKFYSGGANTHNIMIANNDVRQTNEAGIFIQNNNGSATVNASVFGNIVAEPGPFSFGGLYVESGASGSDTSIVNIVVGSAGTAAQKNDFSTGDPFDFGDVNLNNFGSGLLNLSRNGSAGATPADVIDDDNLNPLTTSTADFGVTLVNTLPATPPAVAGCTLPAGPFSLVNPPKEEVAKDTNPAVIDTLFAANGQNPERKNAATLTQAELTAMMPAAIERWRETGISIDDLKRLQALTFEITDLPDGQLASASSTSIKIDENAAGYGWYSDVSPMEDLEFEVPVPNREMQAIEFSPAFGRMDLLTVVMRELGVTYRQGKNKLSKQLLPLMENTLSPAVRRLPDSRNIQLPDSKDKASSKNRAASEKTLASRIGKGSTLRPKSAVATSAGSISNAAFNPSAKQASGRNSRLMHHAPRNRAIAPMLSSMLADVMLNIGTLPAGESVTITFNVTVDDPFGGALPQVSNQGTVSGSNFADVLTDDPTVGGVADPTVTPIDLPDVSVAVSPTSVLEDGATNLVYTFTRDGSTANALTVNFSIGGSANFGASPNDYTQTGAATFTPPTGTVTFGAGNSTATVTVNPETDTTVETDETVVLTVTSGTGYAVGSPSSASGTITNDDADVSVAVAPTSVAEDGATNLVYTFTRVGATANSLTVNFSVGGTANFGASPNDYTQTGATTFTSTSGTVTFGAGNSTATVTVDPEPDTTIESDETVILTLTSGAGYNVSSPSSATGTITNDDADVSVAVAPAAVAEDGATNLVYTFTRTGFTAGALTVNFSVGGTAVFGVSPNDYTQTGATTFTTTTGSVTFGPGNTTATVTVNPETDITAESDETVIITLTAGASYNPVGPTSATGTILNDDTLVSVAVAPSSTAEGGANMVYTFTRTGPTGSALTVNFSVGGSASFPADYTQSGAATFTPPTATVTFGVGSSTKTVTVTPLTDCAVEGPETVVFTVQPGSGYGVGSPSSATGTITNTPDSSAPTITLIPNVNMTLWPPNHQYETVAVTDFVASASDNCDPSVNLNSVYILKITSDEADNGNGDGNTTNDIVIAAGCKTAQLRSERSGNGDGRVYTITFKVKDSVGNFTTATAQVTVRKSPNTPAVDSGTANTVNSGCP